MSRCRLGRCAIAAIPLAVLALGSGCAKKVTSPTAVEQVTPPRVTDPAGGASPRLQGTPVVSPRPTAGSQGTAGAATVLAPATFQENLALRDIYFDFDNDEIRGEAPTILDRNIEWLKAHPRAQVLIEGHCDERGTTESNLALGERRAKSTRNYLVVHRVAGERLTLISYGKERPLCTEHTDACRARNRRAHFLVAE